MTLSDRELFRRRIDSSMTADDAGPRRLGVQPLPRAALAIDWPTGLEPVPVPIDPEPDPTDALPEADAVVFVWTAAEWRALADTLTPGVDGPRRWYRYTRDFERYLPSIRAGAPARNSRRLGAYHLTTIGSRRVLLVKSELHLNQDAVRTGDGTATLPVADFTRQVLAEVQPAMVLTTGTCGATIPTFDLGDVLVTRGAAFRLEQEFRNEPFASAAFTSRWKHRRRQLTPARKAMATFAHELVEPDFGAPTPRYAWTGDLIPGPRNVPSMKLDGDDFPDGHPILSADWFLFGTTTNGVDADGCGVEMGDAVIAMVCEEGSQPGPEWLVVRNLSNPVVDGRLSPEVQNMWSAFYYDTYGYWTSVNSSIACWAALAP